MIKTFNFDGTSEFSANTYLVYNQNNECIIIDYGTTKNTVIKFIEANSLKLKALLLTHGHFDHIRGIINLRKHFLDIPIYIGRYDEELLANPSYNGSHLNNEIVTINIKPLIFKDDEILNFGENLIFKVIETPFHTDGSVCLLNDEENALFTGDTLFKGSIGRYDLVTSNRSLVNSSLEKIKFLNPNLVVYPGHGNITILENELKENIYLK